jgi:hypothetical protein
LLIPFRNEQAVDSILDEFSGPSWAVEAYYGQANGHRFAQDIRKALESGRQNKDIRLRQRTVGIPRSPAQVNVRFKPKVTT